MYTRKVKSGYALEAERLAAYRAAKMGSVPNSPKTPHHSFRYTDELHDKAMAKAISEGETLTDVVVRALEQYVQGDELEGE